MNALINKSGPELVTIYNTCAKLIGEKDVDRFATKSAAVDRTARILAMLNGKNTGLYEQTCVALGLKEAPKAAAPKVEVVEGDAPLTPKAPEAPKPALKPLVKATKADGIDAVEDKAHKVSMKERAELQVAVGTALAELPAPKAKAAKVVTPKAPGRPRDFNFKPFSVHRVPRPGSFLAESLAILSGSGCHYADIVNLVQALDVKRGRGTLAKGSDSIDRRSYELIRDLHFLNGYGIKHDQATGLIRAYTFTK